MGITDFKRVYRAKDLAPGDRIIFAATGVTDGTLMRGVRFFGDGIRTSSVIMQNEPHQIRFIDSIHVATRRTSRCTSDAPRLGHAPHSHRRRASGRGAAAGRRDADSGGRRRRHSDRHVVRARRRSVFHGGPCGTSSPSKLPQSIRRRGAAAHRVRHRTDRRAVGTAPSGRASSRVGLSGRAR